jgi:hypothetical protein
VADSGFAERLKKAQAMRAENEQVARAMRPDDYSLQPPKKEQVVIVRNNFRDHFER